ncbi:RagB/SusD family nutrient uptake outer membrane protein [Pedobacter hiemivivus]|uniref:RagB/SusD family nutrient uptake outer membrane protein n=1 Tax=Pedobacter hiemivivus TaxID=2530454 RepID=A0A4U1GLA0_9SPHI|nr:RagB/SusD family nutrient uptake outer membrane protein [Pedobacter hiemivivus]TKC65141.1 RagB/SusD family nutrient uptake outer membrane protein [Pedobacter hiemivivus]
MKNLKYLILLLLFSSCQKQLIEDPKSLAAEKFYNTAAEVQGAVNAIYTPFRDINGLVTYIAQVDCYVDYGLGRGSYASLNDFQGLNSTNITRVGSMWDLFYLSIRNANFVIKNAPNGKEISQADINTNVGEAKFLRAFNYFFLVRNWGGVPIRTEANMTVVDVKRNTADDVYKLILADLLDAEANLPITQPQVGRPTKWSAKTLLADVYLQLGKYPEARDKANEVILSDKFALVPISSTDDLQNIFGPAVVTTSEEIFYIKFTRQNLFGNYFVMFLNHPGTKFSGAGGFYGLHSETVNPVYKNWDNNDFRKGLWYPYNIGLDGNSLLNKKFIDPLATSQSGHGNDMPWYRYADLLLIYAEAASRAENGPSAASMEALNKVHRRAYGKNPLLPSTVDFKVADYNATTFLDLIIKERGYEFQYEGKRWLELKRTGKAAEIILATKGKVIAAKHYWWPIPVSELGFNKALDPVKDQNPGY